MGYWSLPGAPCVLPKPFASSDVAGHVANAVCLLHAQGRGCPAVSHHSSAEALPSQDGVNAASGQVPTPCTDLLIWMQTMCPRSVCAEASEHGRHVNIYDGRSGSAALLLLRRADGCWHPVCCQPCRCRLGPRPVQVWQGVPRSMRCCSSSALRGPHSVLHANGCEQHPLRLECPVMSHLSGQSGLAPDGLVLT